MTRLLLLLLLLLVLLDSACCVGSPSLRLRGGVFQPRPLGVGVICKSDPRAT
jgi:hypothetical protein